MINFIYTNYSKYIYLTQNRIYSIRFIYLYLILAVLPTMMGPIWSICLLAMITTIQSSGINNTERTISSGSISGLLFLQISISPIHATTIYHAL